MGPGAVVAPGVHAVGTQAVVTAMRAVGQVMVQMAMRVVLLEAVGAVGAADPIARKRCATAGRPAFRLSAVHTALRCCPEKETCAPYHPDRVHPESRS